MTAEYDEARKRDAAMEDKDMIKLIKRHLMKFLKELECHSQVKSQLHESGSGPHNDLIKKCLVQSLKKKRKHANIGKLAGVRVLMRVHRVLSM